MSASRKSKSELRLFRQTNRFVAAILLVYLTLAVGVELVPGREEIFPFASWSLFSRVPNDVRDYSLRILTVNGRPLDQPVYFEDSRHLFTAATDHSARMSIEQLGKAAERKDAVAVERVRTFLEPLHLRGRGAVRYEVVRRRYDAMDRWRDRHAFAEVVSLATFESRGMR